MSTSSSVCRVKERGGGGLKSIAPSGKISPVSGRSMSTGKENSRPTSRIRATTQKPNIRPMVRIDKSAATAAPPVEDIRAEPRARRSTSSVPRGRSCSPSDFTRALSDLRKNSTRVSVGPPQGKVNSSNFKGLNEKSGEKSNLKKRVSKDLDKNREILNEFEGNTRGNGKIKIMVMKDGSIEKKEGFLSSISIKSSDLENFNEKPSLAEGKLKFPGVEVESGSDSTEPKVLNKVSNFPGLPRENGANKYPGKLHEKLAFLEGKVKRIASDIKRTKEILDTNNPDASKMILSDIQEKISGIEKAMGQVACNDGDARMVFVKSGEIEHKKNKKEVGDVKNSVKGFNVAELEARLFPHHKLIRDRSLSKTSDDSEVHVIKVGDSPSVVNVEEKKLSSFNDNAIALEFLASLSKDETKVVAEAKGIQEMDDTVTSIAESSSLNLFNGKVNIDAMLMADEKLNEFDDQDIGLVMRYDNEVEESCTYQLNDIGCKTSTGGWFVSEGESILLAHYDGSCSFYDIGNCEEKAEYKPPAGVSPNMWQDCWIIRAPSADGCSGRYVVAASAGDSVDSGFCSWDFYSKDIRAFHRDDDITQVRPANNVMYKRSALSMCMANENRQWWYKPSGPLIISTTSGRRMVQIYDIRDGDQIMKWESQKPVLAMDYASPLQWRNRGKVVIAEADSISLWDVNSLSPQALLSVSSSGRKITALHVNNSDAELGGGVRQRISSSDAEGNDGVFCTPDSINVLDFRNPSGIGIKIPKVGVNVQSAFSCGDSVYIGCTNLRSTAKKQSSQIQEFSLRKQKLFSTYALPESNAHSHLTALTQVWGNSSLVMGVCRLGLFVFDSLKDDGIQSFSVDYGNVQNATEIIGSDNMRSPSFDYLASRVLLVSRDRPAKWRYLFRDDYVNKMIKL